MTLELLDFYQVIQHFDFYSNVHDLYYLPAHHNQNYPIGAKLFYSENYDPGKDISSFQTRRVYGAMAGYDEPQKIVTGLQLLNAGIIDSQTLQENLDGLDNIVRVNERITREKADKVLFETLLAQAQQGDPKATMTVVQIRKNPADMQNILDKFFTAEEPEIPEAEQSLIQGLPEGAALPPQGAPPGIGQLLQGLGQ